MSHALLHLSRWVSHIRPCTVTKEEEKTRNLDVYLLTNSIACNELTTACRVWYLKSLKACTLFTSYWLICQETRNEVEVNSPRLSVLRLFGFCKSGKTTLVKLVKRFNAKQMQKCSFECLLLASFSVVISLCTVTKEEEKTRNVNVYLLINSIACNELTTACVFDISSH